MKPRRACGAREAVALLLGIASLPVSAQLFVPAQGEGSVSATIQVVTDHWHLTDRGDRAGQSNITSNSVFLKLDYGLTDRLAVTLNVPYVQKRFRAPPGGAPAHDPDPFNHHHDGHEHEHVEELDDGQFHGHWQDWGVGVRFAWLKDPLMVTPFLNYSWPSHDYTFFAHAAPGTRQKRTQLGIAVGRPFGPPWIDTYAQASYSYTLVEKVLGISVNYSTLHLEMGHHFNDRFSGRLFFTYRKTHGGLDFPSDFPWRGSSPAPEDAAVRERFLNHDRIQRIDYLNAGLGLAWRVDARHALSLDYLNTLWGENGHEIHNAVSLGLYRSF
jgi:hypothetical protein